MKREIRKGILVLLVFAFITGCSGKKNISDATLLGYDDVVFEEAMKNYFDDMSNDEVANLSYGWKDGWVGEFAPDSDFLTSNEKAMSFVISVNLVSDNETETNHMVFYMIHNTKDNTVSVQGGLFDENGDTYPMGLIESQELIDEIS